MDWNNLIADETLLLDKHFTQGRGGRQIDKVVIHHNAGNLTVRGCYNVWQTRPASAHYQVESSGWIGQLVRDRDTAWHAANTDANQTSIGVEHANSSTIDSLVTAACLEAGAHLVAALCRFYGLGRPAWKVNVFPHQHYTATGCPGHLAGSQNSQYMQRAQAWYDAMASGGTPPPASPQEDDMPLTEDEILRVANKVIDGVQFGDQKSTLASYLNAAARDSATALKEVRSLRTDLKASTASISQEQIDAAVAKAIAAQVKVEGNLTAVPR